MGYTILMDISKDIIWNREVYKEFVNYLLSLHDEEYKIFNEKLVTSKYKIIGIRVPIIRDIAKRVSKTNYFPLLDLIKDEYYEVVFLEGLLISYIKNYDEVIDRLKLYVNKIDNWAICDMVASSLKIFNKNKERGLSFVDYLINSSDEFSKRFGYVLLLDYYVSEEYLDVIFNYVRKNQSTAYYVNMAVSWLLCECYVKFTDKTFQFIKNTNLDIFVFRKTISKVNDSFRVRREDKNKLKNFKVY